MRKKSCIAVITIIASMSAAADTQRGAKAIFVDTTSGAVVSGSTARSTPRTVNRARTEAQRAPEPPRPPVPEVAGLMYYLEMVSASGQRSRVTADYTFHSGDRILVHVVSSIDGDVAVFQHDPDGVLTQLFPDSRVNGGSAFIPQKIDTVLPSPTAWFRFDDQTGRERLSIVLTPRVKAASPRPAPAITAASFNEIRGRVGSKGLLLETENSGPEQATYVVRPVEHGRAAEPLIVEIVLKHQ